MIGTSSARVWLGGRLQAASSAAARPCPIGARPCKRPPGSRARSQRVRAPSSAPPSRPCSLAAAMLPSVCGSTHRSAEAPVQQRACRPRAAAQVRRYRHHRSAVLTQVRNMPASPFSRCCSPPTHSGPRPQQRAGVGRPAPDVAAARSRAQRAAARRRGQLPGAPPTRLCEQKGWFRCKRLSFRTCCGGG